MRADGCHQSLGDYARAMLRTLLFLAALLCCGCTNLTNTGEPSTVTTSTPDAEPVDLDEENEEEAASELVAEADEDARPVAASITVAEAVRVQPMPYRNERYITRCRRESQQDAPEAETMESKPAARERARALAREGAVDEVLLLSRVAYGETGTPQPGINDDPATPTWDEVDAFLAVMDGRRGLMSRVEMFTNYSPRRIFPHPEDVRQRWIAELQLDGARPPSWPAPRQRRFHGYPPWRSYGCPRWLATVDAVRRVLAAHPRRITAGTGPCEQRPDHWGGEVGVDDRAVRLGWRLVDCGSTRNRFWVIPGPDEEPLPRPSPVLDRAPDADDEPRAQDEPRGAGVSPPEGVFG